MIKIFFIFLVLPCSAAVLHFDKVVDPVKLDGELRAIGVYASYDGKTKANADMSYDGIGSLDITLYREKDFKDSINENKKNPRFEIKTATTTATDEDITAVVNAHVP